MDHAPVNSPLVLEGDFRIYDISDEQGRPAASGSFEMGTRTNNCTPHTDQG